MTSAVDTKAPPLAGAAPGGAGGGDLRGACAQGVRELTRWAARTRLEDIPVEVLARAVRVLADDMAAIIGARDEPEVAEFHRRTLARVRVQDATVYRGGRPRTDRVSAAVANALAGDWLELDEGYRKAPCHAGLYLVPAILAEAEADDLQFGTMLRAIVLGYEIATRLARAWTRPALVMQAHGRYGAIGAAAATALVRGADAELLHSALSGAVTMVIAGPGTHLVAGALVRNAWPAVGAWCGMMSVEWAECGIGGVDDSFFDVYSTVLGGGVMPERITDGLGQDWAILDGYLKVYACCQHLHSTVEAVLAVRGALPPAFAPEDVAEIVVDAHPIALPLVNRRPATTLGAKFSLPHAAAAALVTGTAGADAFLARTLTDAAIAGLREKVRITPYQPVPDPPNDRPSKVHVKLRSGREFVQECLSAQGGPDRPFGPERFVEKITGLTREVYPRFVPVLADLMHIEHAKLARPWRAILDDIAGAAT